MNRMTEEDQVVAIRRLRALLNPKTIDGSLRVADTLSRHPEQFELLFDRRLDWTKADGMELRGAWHRMLSLRPELVGAFLAKLETIAPIHSQVISSETLFEEPVGKQVMAGMAQWERLAGEAGIRQVLLDMTKIQMTRKLILPPDAWRAEHWVREGLRILMDGGSIASETARGLLNHTISLRHSDDMAKTEQPMIVQALMDECGDEINKRAAERPENDRVRDALINEDMELAKLLVNAGYYWEGAMEYPETQAMAATHLIQCPPVRRALLERKVDREPTGKKPGNKM